MQRFLALGCYIFSHVISNPISLVKSCHEISFGRHHTSKRKRHTISTDLDNSLGRSLLLQRKRTLGVLMGIFAKMRSNGGRLELGME